eukprot:scaffold735_cov255-Pinguiococcus_pyrenoidosus.AAC.20
MRWKSLRIRSRKIQQYLQNIQLLVMHAKALLRGYLARRGMVQHDLPPRLVAVGVPVACREVVGLALPAQMLLDQLQLVPLEDLRQLRQPQKRREAQNLRGPAHMSERLV